MTQTTSQLELTNEEVRVSIHRKANCLVELHVFASHPLMQRARKNALKLMNKEISLPGFRKGKAPEDFILKKYPDDFQKKYHKQLADLSFTSAQRLSHIPLLNNNAQISFELKNESDQGAEIYFSFETEPTVPSVDPHLFQSKPVKKLEVTETQVDEAVRQMRFFYANWKNIADRPIQDGDYILISVETWEGSEFQKVFDHIRFEVSKERMAQWMKNLVQGAKAGDVLEGMSEADESATEEEKKSISPKKVRLTIHKVEEAELPPLDDEFAKKVGSTDVLSMREFVQKLLNEKADEKVQGELRDQVNDFLIAHYPFDLPPSLVATEKRDRLSQNLRDPRAKQKWDAMSLEERQKTETIFEQEAIQAIRLFYLSRKIVHDAKLPISHAEVQKEAISTFQGIRGNQKLDTIPKEVYALALSKVLLAKAQDYIVQNVQKS